MIFPAIVVPVYRFPLQKREIKSLDYLFRNLGDFDIIFVSPDIEIPTEWRKKITRAEIFDKKNFSSVDSYSRLLMSEVFYKRFTKYSHILIYQLDCLVFRNDLQQWCEAGWDYIGAPWVESFKNPRDEPCFWGAGNGGLSLRKVSSLIALLECPSRRRVYSNIYFPPYHGFLPFNSDLEYSRKGIYEHEISFYEKLLALFKIWNVNKECLSYLFSEDVFWSFEAHKFNSKFKVATAQDSLNFAFEKNPSWCFEQNNYAFPFGCHAWAKYDISFWTQHFPDLLEE